MLKIYVLDFITKQQTDTETGITYPPFGIKNTDEYPLYRNYNKVPGIVKDRVFIVKATAPINTEMYSYLQAQMSSGNCLFLIDEKEAMVRLMSTRAGRALKPAQRALQIMPFTQTTVLKDQLINLVEEHEGLNIILKPNNSRIKKDKVSAYGYGMYWIKKYEEKKRGRRSNDMSKFAFFN